MVWLLLLVTACWGADVYVDARVDVRGDLRIRTADRRVIVQKKKADQTKFERIAISPDKRSVGWINLLRHNYGGDPLPLSLSVFTNGKVLEFNALPAYWGWWFWQDGKQVVSYQETLHGGLQPIRYATFPPGRRFQNGT